MLHIYGMDVAPLYEERLFEECLLKIDAGRRDKALAHKMQKDRCLSLGCGLLLQKAAGDLGEARLKPAGELVEMVAPQDVEYFRELAYGVREGGKPYWPDYPHVSFNLSHSGSYAVCAVSDREVGADIQQRRFLRPPVAERFYTAGERKLLKNAGSGAEREELFYRIWAVKESYVKLAGKGLALDFKSFGADLETKRIRDVKDGKELASFLEFQVGRGYCGSVCVYPTD